MNWVQITIVSLFLWGFWAFFAKLAGSEIPWNQAIVFSAVGTVITAGMVYGVMRPSLTLAKAGSVYALISGLLAGIGLILFYTAFSMGGPASLIVPITGLYPAIAVIVSRIVLREPLTKFHILGLILALVAILLLTKE